MKRLRQTILVVAMAFAAGLLSFGVGLAQSTTVDVTLGMSEFKFEPAELDVQAGTTVTFKVSNTGQFPHNVTFVAPDGTETNLFAENLAAGQSATGTFTFGTAGQWSMYCPVGQHKDRGMVGVVRVAAAAQQPAAAAAQQPAAAAASPATLPTTGAPAMLASSAVVALLAVAAGIRLRRRS